MDWDWACGCGCVCGKGEACGNGDDCSCKCHYFDHMDPSQIVTLCVFYKPTFDVKATAGMSRNALFAYMNDFKRSKLYDAQKRQILGAALATSCSTRSMCHRVPANIMQFLTSSTLTSPPVDEVLQSLWPKAKKKPAAKKKPVVKKKPAKKPTVSKKIKKPAKKPAKKKPAKKKPCRSSGG